MEAATVYVRWLAVLGSTLVLAACGGGGSSSGGQNNPPPATYTVGGTVSGLTVDGLVLASNGATVTVNSGASTFSFAAALASGTAYAVTVQTTPNGLTCSVANGTGTVAAANVSNIVVTCSGKAYALGGTISGLVSSGLVLSNGTDQLSVASGATSFTMPNQVAFSSSYDVKVTTQPQGLTCSVQNGTATMGAAAVTNIAVTCTVQKFTVGGSVSGLTASGLVLANGSDTVAVPANATSFTMPTAVAFMSSYTVSAASEPTGLTCPITGASGTMPGMNVNSVQVTCSGSMWTWFAGSNASTGFAGVYGTQGTAAAGNLPGSRDSHMTWTDSNGHLWLFGGSALDAGGLNGDLNDMWSYDPATHLWTWVSGSNLVTPAADAGNYGTQGTAAAGNVPPARHGATTWVDAAGRLWMFGGANYNGASPVHFNDLWSFDTGTKWWTYVGGTSAQNDAGNYGVKGTAAPGNAPPSRTGGTGWIDSTGRLWLFGGLNTSPTLVNNTFSDLWSFDPTAKEWTWVSGSSAMNDYAGTYGSQNVGNPSNSPPTRFSASGWIDGSTGLLWLFGGGYDNAGTAYGLNDLWTFNPANGNWTWVGGSNGTNSLGAYGTKGVAAGSNQPGARGGSVAWADKQGRFWLFGGLGYDAPVAAGGTGARGSLNDLWTFSPSSGQWTWVGGALTVNASGQYGTQGTAASGNMPGARSVSSGWIDATGHLWLFGGSGVDSGGNSGDLNDLWKF